MNMHKRNNTKTQYKQYKTVNTSTHITKQPHNCQNIHTLQNPHIHKPTHYKTSSNNHSTRFKY